MKQYFLLDKIITDFMITSVRANKLDKFETLGDIFENFKNTLNVAVDYIKIQLRSFFTLNSHVLLKPLAGDEEIKFTGYPIISYYDKIMCLEFTFENVKIRYFGNAEASIELFSFGDEDTIADYPDNYVNILIPAEDIQLLIRCLYTNKTEEEQDAIALQILLEE